MSDTIDVDKGSLHVHLSRLLLGSLIAGIASTIAVAVFGVLAARPRPAPVIGVPPPPPDIGGLVISVGFCVVAWVAVLVALARDQVFRRIDTLEAKLGSFAAEYGEQRDTDGYLRAMRAAGTAKPPGDLRPLHRVTPPAAPSD